MQKKLVKAVVHKAIGLKTHPAAAKKKISHHQIHKIVKKVAHAVNHNAGKLAKAQAKVRREKSEIKKLKKSVGELEYVLALETRNRHVRS